MHATSDVLQQYHDQPRDTHLPNAPPTQVQRNVGHGCITIDEYFYSSMEHVGICNMSCNLAVDPPTELRGTDASKYYAGRAGLKIGDPCQHKQPRGTPVYGGAAKYIKDRNYNPGLRPMRAPPARQDTDAADNQPTEATAPPPHAADAEPEEGAPTTQDHRATQPTPTNTAARAQRQQQLPARARAVQPDTADKDTLLNAGFTAFRGFEDTVILNKQQRQNSSDSGKELQEMASLFNGTHGFDTSTDEGKAQLKAAANRMVTRLNRQAIKELQDLTSEGKRVRVVTLTNDTRHYINKTCMKMDAIRLGKRITAWNARHHRCGPDKEANKHGLTAIENVCAMHVPDKEFDHFTADTHVFPGCLMTLLTTNPEAGAARNMVVRVLGLITESREEPDDGTGPYRRLTYLPKGIIVEHVTGAATANFIEGEKEFEDLPNGAFIVKPEASHKTKTITVPNENGTERSISVKRFNVPLGDAYCVTDYFVQVSTWEGRAHHQPTTNKEPSNSLTNITQLPHALNTLHGYSFIRLLLLNISLSHHTTTHLHTPPPARQPLAASPSRPPSTMALRRSPIGHAHSSSTTRCTAARLATPDSAPMLNAQQRQPPLQPRTKYLSRAQLVTLLERI